MHPALRYLSAPGGTMVGTASPVRMAPGENLLVHAATSGAGPGDVLVIDAGGELSRSEKGNDAVGPCPTDHGKPGTTRHLLIDRWGVPLVTGLTGAKQHDSTVFAALFDAAGRGRQAALGAVSLGRGADTRLAGPLPAADDPLRASRDPPPGVPRPRLALLCLNALTRL